MLVRALGVAVCAVLPLFASSAWSGFRLAFADPVLSVIATSEQPLSVRSAAGVWGMALVLLWFGLGYGRRRIELWEVVLIMLGGAIALARLGNVWFFGLAMVPPLARQLLKARPDPRLLAAVAGLSLCLTGFVAIAARPPALTSGAESAVLSASAPGEVLADWRFAGQLQKQLGDRVVPKNGLASEDGDFWKSYVRIMQGHEHWLQDLQNLNASVVVLDSVDQDRAAANLIRTSSGWRITFDTDGVLVAERTGQ